MLESELLAKQIVIELEQRYRPKTVYETVISIGRYVFMC